MATVIEGIDTEAENHLVANKNIIAIMEVVLGKFFMIFLMQNPVGFLV